VVADKAKEAASAAADKVRGNGGAHASPPPPSGM
jgi:hypothetical protein